MYDRPSLTMRPLEWAMLGVLSIFWGGSFLFVGIAVNDFQAFTIAFLRVIVGGGVLWMVLLVSRTALPKGRRIWTWFFVLGAINSAVPFFLMAWGQARVASGLASVLIATTPIFTVVFAHFATTDERMTVARLAGVVFGVLGVATLFGGDAMADIGHDLFGQLAILAAAANYASASIFGRRFSKHGVRPLAVATGQVSAAAVLLLPMVLWIDQPWRAPAPELVSWAAVVSLGVISTGLAYLIYFRVLATAGATNLMLVNFLVPVTAIILGILVLGETLLRGQVIGMVLIAIGLALIDGRVLRRWRAA